VCWVALLDGASARRRVAVRDGEQLAGLLGVSSDSVGLALRKCTIGIAVGPRDHERVVGCNDTTPASSNSIDPAESLWVAFEASFFTCGQYWYRARPVDHKIPQINRRALSSIGCVENPKDTNPKTKARQKGPEKPAKAGRANPPEAPAGIPAPPPMSAAAARRRERPRAA